MALLLLLAVTVGAARAEELTNEKGRRKQRAGSALIAVGSVITVGAGVMAIVGGVVFGGQLHTAIYPNPPRPALSLDDWWGISGGVAALGAGAIAAGTVLVVDGAADLERARPWSAGVRVRF